MAKFKSSVFLLLGPFLQNGLACNVHPGNSNRSPIYPVDRHTARLSLQDHFYGVREVSYWVTDNGLAIIDGDVIYGPLDTLFSHSLIGHANATNLTSRAHSVIAGGGATWPSANVMYKFDSASTETLLSATVNGAIAKWKALAPYLTFTKLANSATPQNGVAMIQAPSCGGCSSSIGYSNSPLNMLLQQSCTSSPGFCGVAEATHEFGHLLGLYHEHQRRDRESYVHYHCENLDPTCPTGVTMPAGKTCCDSGIPAGCCTKAGNFNVLSGSNFDASGPFDANSIMMYISSAFAKPGTNTLTAVAPGLVLRTSNPSDIDSLDSQRVCKLYSAQCPKAQNCRAAGCPSTCAPLRFCKESLCANPRNGIPPCCDGIPDPSCTKKRAQCTSMGCDFLV